MMPGPQFSLKTLLCLMAVVSVAFWLLCTFILPEIVHLQDRIRRGKF